MGRWGSPKPKRSAQEKREQVLTELLQGKQARRGQDSVHFLLLSGSTQSMAGFDAKQVRKRVRDSLAVLRRLRLRIADSDIWHVLAANTYALPGPEEVTALGRELGVDRQLVNFAAREVLKCCLSKYKLTPGLLSKLNALRGLVKLPALEWDDERLAEARAHAGEEGGQ